MFHAISKRIIAYAVKCNALDGDKAEEYIYGLEITLSVFASYLSVLIIGLILGMLWQAMLFLFVFVSVRRFSGGFHFGSQLLCYLSMCVTCPTVLLIIKHSANNFIPTVIAMAISNVVLLIFSPVQAVEKPLDKKEKVVYGTIARLIIVVIDVIYAVLCFFGQYYIAKIITVTIFTAAIFMIMGKIKLKLYGGNL